MPTRSLAWRRMMMASGARCPASPPERSCDAHPSLTPDTGFAEARQPGGGLTPPGLLDDHLGQDATAGAAAGARGWSSLLELAAAASGKRRAARRKRRGARGCVAAADAQVPEYNSGGGEVSEGDEGLRGGGTEYGEEELLDSVADLRYAGTGGRACCVCGWVGRRGSGWVGWGGGGRVGGVGGGRTPG